METRVRILPGISARGTGREGSAFPAPRDAGPYAKRPETGPVVCAVSTADEDAFRTRPPPPPVVPPPVPLPVRSLPPGTPGCGIRPEMEIRAERFPAGIAGGGATGAGVAERAISVLLSPKYARRFRAPPPFVSPFWVAAGRGADIGTNGKNRLWQAVGLGNGCSDVDDACVLFWNQPRYQGHSPIRNRTADARVLGRMACPIVRG